MLNIKKHCKICTFFAISFSVITWIIYGGTNWHHPTASDTPPTFHITDQDSHSSLLGEDTDATIEENQIFPKPTQQEIQEIEQLKCNKNSNIDTGFIPKPGAYNYHSCDVNQKASPGCQTCRDKVKGSWEFIDPFNLPEFKLDVRTHTSNFLPILADLDKEVAKIKGQRVVLDIGYTHEKDLQWVTELYGKDSKTASSSNSKTKLHIYEPNPLTHDAIKKTLSKTPAYSSDTKLKISLFNKGIGKRDGSHMFWFNKDGSRSSFQRVRGDDYEQIPIRVNVSKLDTVFKELGGDVVIPFMKVRGEGKGGKKRGEGGREGGGKKKKKKKLGECR